MNEMEKEEKQREHVDIQDAFDALMGGLLTNVKERQPDPNEEVVCRMVSNGAFVSGYIYQEDEKYKVATSPDFHFGVSPTFTTNVTLRLYFHRNIHKLNL